MGVRWTEEDLARFQRNSGRGLPKETVRQMERATGVKLDEHGEPVPTKARPIPNPRMPAAEAAEVNKQRAASIGKRRKDNLELARAAKRGRPKPASLEAQVERELARGKRPVSTERPTIAPFEGARHQAPSIARYRKRAECDGITFDSQLEMRRYKELKLLKAAGEILYFLRQVPFYLPGGIVARLDFMVVYPHLTADDEPTAWVRLEYEDCKAGAKGRSKGRYNDADRVGVNKRKQIKALYGVTVKLVTKARG